MTTATTDLPLADIVALRASLETLSDPIPAADGVRIAETWLASVRCLEVSGPSRAEGTILYVHGGAFCLFRADSYLKMAGHLAVATGTRVVLPDYRLPPEYAFPHPMLDVLSVYAALVREVSAGDASTPFVLAGDSAGANLGLAGLGLARQIGLPMPVLVVLFSPWIDLALGAASVVQNAASDTELDPKTLAAYARAYAGQVPLDHPLLAPRSFASGSPQAPAFPSLLIQAGEDEILVDDARDLAASAAAAGIEVTLDIAAGMQHNYPFWGPLRPPAMRAYAMVADRIEPFRRREPVTLTGGTCR